MEPLVQCHDVTRSYTLRKKAGRFRRITSELIAVSQLNLQVDAGESVGFIGANGAGKSTTIKMLTGILVPTSGTVRVCGLEPVSKRRLLASRVGVVFGQRTQLWWDLPLRDSFALLASIHRLPEMQWRPRLADLVDRLELGEFLATPVRSLSLGQRMRGDVAAALLHRPPLIILDEPTIGLDLLSKARLREFLVSERRDHGTTLLLTTHDMGDVQHLCDRLVVIDRGRQVFAGTQAELHAEVGARRHLTVTYTGGTSPTTWTLPDGVTLDPDDPPTASAELGEGRLSVEFAADDITAADVLTAISRHCTVTDLTLREPTVETLVAQLYASYR